MIAPALYRSPISLPERRVGAVEVRHSRYKPGDRLPVVGLREALLTGQTPTAVVLSEPLVVHQLYEAGGLWMSDSPQELNQIAVALATVKPRGDVLVGGLGLGVYAAALRARRGVRDVVVVEINPDVVKLCRKAAAGCEVVTGDVLEYLKTEPRRFDCYMLDTWGGTSESTWWDEVMPQRRAIANRHGRRKVWCWAEDEMLGQVRASALRMAGKFWNYRALREGIDARVVDRFVRNVGLPSWEREFGRRVDDVLERRREEEAS